MPRPQPPVPRSVGELGRYTVDGPGRRLRRALLRSSDQACAGSRGVLLGLTWWSWGPATDRADAREAVRSGGHPGPARRRPRCAGGDPPATDAVRAYRQRGHAGVWVHAHALCDPLRRPEQRRLVDDSIGTAAAASSYSHSNTAAAPVGASSNPSGGPVRCRVLPGAHPPVQRGVLTHRLRGRRGSGPTTSGAVTTTSKSAIVRPAAADRPGSIQSDRRMLRCEKLAEEAVGDLACQPQVAGAERAEAADRVADRLHG